MKKAKYLFGDIVVIDNTNIGVIVKTWNRKTTQLAWGFSYEVYKRMTNSIQEYREKEIKRYRVRHKYLDENELKWQNNE